MECDSIEYTDSKQLLGGINLWKKTPFTIAFLEEWLHYCLDSRIITDVPNSLGKNNYPEFKAHRHDQSVFSLLCKKYNLQSFPDPTQFGNNERNNLENPYLKQFLHHTKGDKIKRTLLQKIVHEVSRPFKNKK